MSHRHVAMSRVRPPGRKEPREAPSKPLAPPTVVSKSLASRFFRQSHTPLVVPPSPNTNRKAATRAAGTGAAVARDRRTAAQPPPEQLPALAAEFGAFALLDESAETVLVNDELPHAFRDFATKLWTTLHRRCQRANRDGGKTRIAITVKQYEALWNHMNGDYTEMLLDQSYEGHHDDLELHLMAANHVVQDFLQLQTLFHETRTPTRLRHALWEGLERFLAPRLVEQYQARLTTMTPAEAARTISWLDDFQESARARRLRVSDTWQHDQERLLQVYLQKGVRNEMATLVQRLAEQYSADEIRHDEHGHLVSTLPETVSFLYQQQHAVALECIPLVFHEQVLAACNEELGTLAGALLLVVHTVWKENNTGTHQYCALINDIYRLGEQCDNRNEEVLTNPAYMEAAEALSATLTQFSLQTTSFLCERIFTVLQEPESVLAPVGTAPWERQEIASPVDRTIATLQDYFVDLEAWLSGNYYYPKVLKQSLDFCVHQYVTSFFVNTMARGVHNPAAAAREIRNDHHRLDSYFSGEDLMPHHGVAGFYTRSQISLQLCILQNMAALIDPQRGPDDVGGDLKAVLVRLDRDVPGNPAVLHLLGLRKRHRGKESAEWLRAIAKAKQAVELDLQGNNATADSRNANNLLLLPKLCESRFLHNLRTGNGVQRQLSNTTQDFIESTRQLLVNEAKGLQRIRMYATHRGVGMRGSEKRP
ncbi:predicted protein [Phaeodactylum tricornutum CCAP 1055/1]|jgi:hypothetical protein|uniref:Exocyst complex component Sec6 n=1 Tax=Phaeodactylum tricornutum (strain CCAP 1055/1) TaxID=556484 RepID=B7G4Q1_PHATC|nr:predicted protein [Phaeodactylum tricornutum CCAP 1055/1]EEC46654.1 predicted protein [Phaeodactylum tricornutum CCAP 1055/1]|eukprot:XP_002182114.1 predicted protein [Phaeodactylum tricornutum CCAP 1055/1]